jgi:hypothetical protein
VSSEEASRTPRVALAVSQLTQPFLATSLAHQQRDTPAGCLQECPKESAISRLLFTNLLLPHVRLVVNIYLLEMRLSY